MSRSRFLSAIALALAGLVIAVPAFAQASPFVSQRQILVMVRHPPDHYRPSGGYGGSYGDDLERSARERLARSIAHDHGLTFVESWAMPMIGLDCFVMTLPEGHSVDQMTEELSHDSKIAWTEPVQLYAAKSETIPNDPLYRAQPAAREWRLADLHRISTGRGIRIAVIDSGIEANHPDLAGQLLLNRNFVAGQSEAAEDHGTGVAGVIAAKSDNGIGIAGIAPGARLLGLRACWQQRAGAETTICDGLSLAKALYFAIEKKADVINLSLSGPDDRLLRMLIEAAIGRGEVVVTAFDAAKPDGGFPASVEGVVAVSDRSLAPSFGRVYTAPGRDVPTTQPGGRWFLVNGSSFSAAHVSGLAALVKQRRASGLSLVSDRPIGGRIDACATLARAARVCDCACGDGRLASGRFAH